MATLYAFRPMTTADFPVVRRWLAKPHVREWWGDPEEQYALVSGDLDEPAMDQYVVSATGGDFGYFQCYDLAAWNSGFGTQPEGTRGIDLFIGEPGMIERGHGSALIRSFVDDRLTCTARRASSPTPIPPTTARCAPMRRLDSKKQVWSIRPMVAALLMVRNP